MKNMIRHWRDKRGWSRRKLADEVGCGETTITKLERGERKLTQDWMNRIAPVLDCAPADLLPGGYEATSSETPPVTPPMPAVNLIPVGLEPVTVLGEVQAGAWVEAWQWPEAEQWAFPAPTRRMKFADSPKFALEVKGPSMDLVYPEGTILICVEWWRVNRVPRTGEKVIVSRQRAGLVEATVKEIEVSADGSIRLWPRSSHPRFQTPIELPRDGLPWGLAEGPATFIGGQGLEDAHDEINLSALVVGAFRPEP